jgi:filamentous hemagglutinin family protein
MIATRLSHAPHLAAMVATLLFALGGVFSNARAQVNTNITVDGTLGTRVTPAGNIFNIDGGTINGSNQFHSFGQFSVGTGNTVNFSVGNTIQNIISRVTGGMRSHIDGTLTSTISGTSTVSNANLFLLNPAGILFGPNAQLNIGGSFHASTGDYVKLGTDGIFHADPAKASALTSAPPSAFGFLTSNPAAIDVQTGVFNEAFTNPFAKRLEVPVGKTLSLVGGPVNVGAPPGQPNAGFVFAPGGVVNIASVASPGEATFANGINVDAFAKLGEIRITGGAVVDGREINIRGGRLEITDAMLFPGVSSLVRPPDSPAPNGGQVSIRVTDDVTITGTRTLRVVPGTQRFSGVETFAGSPSSPEPVPGDVPGVNIEAGRFSMSGAAGIVTKRFGPGKPSAVVIAADTIELRNGALISMTNFFGGGPFSTDGGTVTINGNNMTLSSDGRRDRPTGIIASPGLHPGFGASIVPLFVAFFQLANSASVTINLTGTLAVRENAQITTDSSSFGPAGAINVNAANISLVGAGPQTGRVSALGGLVGESGSVKLTATGKIDVQNGFLISASTEGSGNGGIVALTAGESITLGANSRISSGTLPAPDQELNNFAQRFSGFFRIPLDYASLRTLLGIAPAPGDLMQVLAELNAIRDPAGNPLVAVTDFTAGDAGRISIITPLLTMNGDTRIETSTGWDGNAGSVVANVGSLFLNDGAAVRSTSGIVRLTGEQTIGAGNAGSVTITATGPNTISISGRSPTTGAGSSISTTTQGAGNGGDIVLSSAGTVQISNGGLVTADSLGGTGLAGNINISAGDQIVMIDGSVSTRATTSDGGNINFNAPNFIGLTNSHITTSVESGFGGGGNITIDPQFLILNNSQILANAFGGPGGNINITAGSFLVNSGGTVPLSLAGIVDASSALSTSGTVVIEATFTNVNGSFAQLPSTPLQATELLRASCAARFTGGKASSLVLGGRDGLPLQPGDLLPSPLYVTGPSSGDNKLIAEETPLRFTLLDSKNRLLNKYSLLPNVKCSPIAPKG